MNIKPGDTVFVLGQNYVGTVIKHIPEKCMFQVSAEKTTSYVSEFRILPLKDAKRYLENLLSQVNSSLGDLE